MSMSDTTRLALPTSLPAIEPGHVWLAGAGPGDPGLLTLLAAKALSEADVRAGHRVLRLKGGDPFVFGRGGEEALTLIEHDVPFRIVPGITAGIGGLAYAGIPVTHREVNHAVTFLTGHDSSGVVPDRIDWEAIGRGSPVIVMYMAMKHMGQIAANLMAAGRRADESVAFVCNAATPHQSVLETTLGRAEADMLSAGIEPPAIVVIGEVVRLRPSLDWLGALSGRRLLPDPFAVERKDTA